MTSLPLNEYHKSLGAHFIEVNGWEVPAHYGDVVGEHAALRKAAAVIDLSYRGRLCLMGADRQRFLHGQVTNNIHELKVGQGCYAALVTAKGKMVSDLNAYLLPDEILLDFEPGLAEKVAQRLEKYIIADDVQVVDVASHYGMISVQGPGAAELIRHSQLGVELPNRVFGFRTTKHETAGEIYVMNLPRASAAGFDLFVPVVSLREVAEGLVAAAKAGGGGVCGWQACEIGRIEAGIPRFGVDMDETNLPPEAGLESRAISYTKGCYIGQEVIARIRTYGQVAKALRGLRLSDDLKTLPVRGDKLFKGEKDAGYITSAVESPVINAKIAFGYVRRDFNQTGAEFVVRTSGCEGTAEVVDLPFRGESK